MGSIIGHTPLFLNIFVYTSYRKTTIDFEEVGSFYLRMTGLILFWLFAFNSFGNEKYIYRLWTSVVGKVISQY